MGFKISVPKIKIDAKTPGNVFKNFNPLGQTAGLYGGIAKRLSPKEGGPVGYSDSGIPQFAMRKTEDFIKDTPAMTLPGSEAMAKRYANMRERASQESNAAAQTANDALVRRFSAMGGAGSGAMIKLQQQSNEQAEKQRAQTMTDLDVAQAMEQEQRDVAQADMNFKNKVFNFERGSKLHELDLAERQQQIDASTTEFNKRMAEQAARPPKKGLLGGLFDGLF